MVMTRKFTKFTIVSGMGWGIDLLIFTVATHILQWNAAVSNILSAAIAVIFVYVNSTRYIFQHDGTNFKLKFFIYAIYQLCSIVMFSLLIDVVSSWLLDFSFFRNFSSIFAKIAVTPFTLLTNFLFMRYLVEKASFQRRTQR